MKSSDAVPFAATDWGFVFMGTAPMTDEDVQALKAYTRQDDPAIDQGSVVGRYDYNWSCQEPQLQHVGGGGSHTYETQALGQGVEFRATPENPENEAIYHVDPDGNFTHGVLDYPRTGTAFHRDEHHTTVAGPAPGSEAEKLLGDGKYVWSDMLKLWVIEE